MSERIGRTFQRAATGPLNYVASLLVANKVSASVTELSPAPLWQAFERGVADVAKLVGVRSQDVLDVLPYADLQAVHQRLAQSQASVAVAWQTVHGPFGLMEVTTAMTVEAQAPPVATGLLKLARKMAQDKHLAVPLERLATDVSDWEDLLVRCRHILDGRTVLVRAYRRRRLRRMVAVVIPATLLFFGIGCVGLALIARSRIDRVLDTPDPCAGGDIPSPWIASSTQHDRARARAASCEETRAAARRAEEEARAKEAQARAEQEARARREAECSTLASAALDGKAPDGPNLTDAQRALLERISQKRLSAPDLGPETAALPCEGTPAHKELERAFGQAMLTDTGLWARGADPSPLTHRLLVEKKDELPREGLIGLADHGETLAKTGLIRGDAAMLARARRLCSLAEELGVPGHGGCSAASKLQ